MLGCEYCLEAQGSVFDGPCSPGDCSHIGVIWNWSYVLTYLQVHKLVCAEGRRGSQTSRTITLRQDLSGNRELIIVARLSGSDPLCWDSGQV